MLHAAKVIICPVRDKFAFGVEHPLRGSHPSISSRNEVGSLWLKLVPIQSSWLHVARSPQNCRERPAGPGRGCI
jgi:hypothetical protein